MSMEETPFDSLARGLDKDLSGLLDPEKSAPLKGMRPKGLAAVFGIPDMPFGLATARVKAFGQQPFESLSDKFAHEIVMFPLANRVVMNKCGAFIPQSIFGTETELSYREERNQNGVVSITVYPNQSVTPATKQPNFRITRRNIKISDDFEPPRRDDPIFDIGKEPVTCGIPDASENLDKYLYGGE